MHFWTPFDVWKNGITEQLFSVQLHRWWHQNLIISAYMCIRCDLIVQFRKYTGAYSFWVTHPFLISWALFFQVDHYLTSCYLVACTRLCNALWQSVGLSVAFSFCGVFGISGCLLYYCFCLYAWVSLFHYYPCPPARDFGSRVFGLVFTHSS